MTDHEMELFNQLAEDESFMEAAKLLDEADNHGENCGCGPCSFRAALQEIMLLGDAFEQNAEGDEGFVSPLDFALLFVENGAQAMSFASVINEAIKTLAQLASAVSYAGWHIEKDRADERGEDFGCDCDHG